MIKNTEETPEIQSQELEVAAFPKKNSSGQKWPRWGWCRNDSDTTHQGEQVLVSCEICISGHLGFCGHGFGVPNVWWKAVTLKGLFPCERQTVERQCPILNLQVIQLTNITRRMFFLFHNASKELSPLLPRTTISCFQWVNCAQATPHHTHTHRQVSGEQGLWETLYIHSSNCEVQSLYPEGGMGMEAGGSTESLHGCGHEHHCGSVPLWPRGSHEE